MSRLLRGAGPTAGGPASPAGRAEADFGGSGGGWLGGPAHILRDTTGRTGTYRYMAPEVPARAAAAAADACARGGAPTVLSPFSPFPFQVYEARTPYTTAVDVYSAAMTAWRVHRRA